MNKATAHYINQLLDESELFKKTSSNNHQNKTFDFSEETLLITGAAGSIGSGITKQLLHCNFKKLILVDNAESPFYFLINELQIENNPDIECLLTDIRDESSMQWLLKHLNQPLFFIPQPTSMFP